MKKEIRKIVVQEQTFLYTLKEELKKDETKGSIYWLNTLRIYLETYKKTPLVVSFNAKDDYYMGNMLTKEIVDGLNLHFPSVIQKIISFALEKKWQATQAGMSISNGLLMLQELGFDITSIDPNTETIHELLIEPFFTNNDLTSNE